MYSIELELAKTVAIDFADKIKKRLSSVTIERGVDDHPMCINYTFSSHNNLSIATVIKEYCDGGGPEYRALLNQIKESK